MLEPTVITLLYNANMLLLTICHISTAACCELLQFCIDCFFLIRADTLCSQIDVTGCLSGSVILTSAFCCQAVSQEI